MKIKLMMSWHVFDYLNEIYYCQTTSYVQLAELFELSSVSILNWRLYKFYEAKKYLRYLVSWRKLIVKV